MSKTKILVTGCKGRMGQAVIRAVEATMDAEVGAAVDVGDSLADALAKCDVVIDFTSHHFSDELVAACVKAGKAFVMGTTGHTNEERARIHEAAHALPVVHAGNFSVGVNTLFWLTRKATEILGSDFDLEVVEMHHRMKVDAPSGTALLLGEAAAKGRDIDLATHSQRVRDGHTGARTPGDIGFATLRGGTVIGDHSVIFAGPGERLELAHKAEDRGLFARGAVRAALWGNGRKPGHYSMADVLGLND